MSAEEIIDLAPENQSWQSNLWVRLYGAFCRHLAFGSLILRLPNGPARLYRGRFPGGAGELCIERPWRLFRRLLTRGDIGLGEGYLEGDWTTPDLPALLGVLHLNMEHLGAGPRGLAWSRRLDRLTHRLRTNHRRNSRRNVSRHYDLGNDFYRLWLDPGMTYSSAIFGADGRDSLEIAQQRKYDRLLDAIDAKPGETVLEIGCGWGGFAEAAARRGLKVLGVTLSTEQLAYAQKRIADAGLSDQVELRLQDYRDISGEFDHGVSIEMLEAVGESYWPTYFQALRRLVRPGGRVAIQVITLHEDDFPVYQRTTDFIQLYIFPGGMLPSPDRLEQEAKAAGLVPLGNYWMGLHYAETLRHWRRAFHGALPDIDRLGYDARFRRMWDYYLAYCEVGFESGSVDLVQALFQNPAPTAATASLA